MFTPTLPGPGGIGTAQVSGGPNDGLWYITSLTMKLEMHAQVLKDLRPDGNTYSVGTDSTQTACANNGITAAEANVTTINLSCWLNSSYTAFYDRIWRHERCHAVLAIAQFEAIVDAKTLGERVVAHTDTLARDSVTFQPNGLNDASSSVNAASKVIDAMTGSTYPAWLFNPNTISWRYGSIQSNDALVTGC